MVSLTAYVARDTMFLWDEAGGFEGLVVVELVGFFEHLFYLRKGAGGSQSDCKKAGQKTHGGNGNTG
jgi:hypothetical protein